MFCKRKLSVYEKIFEILVKVEKNLREIETEMVIYNENFTSASKLNKTLNMLDEVFANLKQKMNK